MTFCANPVVGNGAPHPFEGDNLVGEAVGIISRFRADSHVGNVGNLAVSGEEIPFSATVCTTSFEAR